MWHPTKTCSLTVKMVMDQLTDECIQGYLFFRQAMRDEGLIKPCPLTIVVWRFKIKILWMVVVGPRGRHGRRDRNGKWFLVWNAHPGPNCILIKTVDLNIQVCSKVPMWRSGRLLAHSEILWRRLGRWKHIPGRFWHEDSWLDNRLGVMNTLRWPSELSDRTHKTNMKFVLCW